MHGEAGEEAEDNGLGDGVSNNLDPFPMSPRPCIPPTPGLLCAFEGKFHLIMAYQEATGSEKSLVNWGMIVWFLLEAV